MNLPEPYYSNDVTNQSPTMISLDSFKESGFYRIVQEFMKAKYGLSLMELKVWLVFISQMKEFRNQENIVYTLDPIEIADILHINVRKARSKMIVETFKSLVKKTIEIENKAVVDKHGQHAMFISGYFASALYNPKDGLIRVRMVPELHKLLFNYVKDMESVGINLQDLLSLKKTVSIRVFIALMNLEERGINSISIEDFRQIINSEAYDKFYELKRRVIGPVETDIRTNTSYKEFSFSDNSSQGKKATTLFFELKDTNRERLEAKARRDSMLETFRNAPPSVRIKLKELTDKTLSALEHAVFLGFDMGYLAKIPLDKEGLVVENIYSAMDWIHDQVKRYNKTFSADERGRLIYSAIMKNKANVVDTKEEKQERLVLTSETDTSTLEAMYLAAARKYVKSMSNNDYMTFAVNNQRDIERLFRQRFDLNDLLKRDGRKSAYKLLIKYIVLLATKNQIDLGIQVK